MRVTKDNISGGSEVCEHETVDLDVPELEALLTRGGFGESGYDRTELVGVEVRC